MSLRSLAGTYEALLLDAYGVLVDGSGAMAGAVEAVAMLNESSTPWLVLTNDASRHPATSAQRYRTLGLEITEEQIITSGSLIGPWFVAQGLAGAPTTVLGPEDSRRYASDAGALIVPPGDDRASVLIVADDAGFPFLSSIEAAISSLFRRIDAGREVRLLLPNPDLIYPKSPGEFGITAGSIASLIESALVQRYPERQDLRFERLGKPFSPIYETAIQRLQTRNVCMVGDQLATDIAGALKVGIDAALITGGVGVLHPDNPIQPTWLTSLTGT